MAGLVRENIITTLSRIPHGGHRIMKWFRLLRMIAPGVMLALLIFGCSGGGGNPVTPEVQDSSRNAVGGVLTLGEPVDTGDEILIPVEYSQAEDLYAFSFRVGFDSEGLEPAGIEWGEMIQPEDSKFHLLNRCEYIPIAFARFDSLGGMNGTGILCTLRFRMKDRDRAEAWIIDDEEFLVARNSIGNRLRLEVGGGER